jgi:hypothetical protein
MSKISAKLTHGDTYPISEFQEKLLCLVQSIQQRLKTITAIRRFTFLVLSRHIFRMFKGDLPTLAFK